MRRIIVILVVVTALLVCGIVVASAAFGGGSTPISKEQAVAFAQAVNLQTSDLPGSRSPAKQPPAPSTIDFRCGHRGKVHTQPIGAEESALAAGEYFVASAVLVMPSEALAQSELATLGSRRGRACLVHRLGEVEEKTYAAKATFVPVQSCSVREQSEFMSS